MELPVIWKRLSTKIQSIKQFTQEIRYLGCELIQSGAILLKLSQTAAATGQILFQRFYYQKSFVRYNFEVLIFKFIPLIIISFSTW